MTSPWASFVVSSAFGQVWVASGESPRCPSSRAYASADGFCKPFCQVWESGMGLKPFSSSWKPCLFVLRKG
ncbi:hypothetical protein GGR52DRAFT_527704 [Hypoxylon sp. FL1284]|nr:hypothetical protein GGR52DRAFT_527704 [Hypoxylon sp. FL1284]